MQNIEEIKECINIILRPVEFLHHSLWDGVAYSGLDEETEVKQ